jgi:hypothetical protein
VTDTFGVPVTSTSCKDQVEVVLSFAKCAAAPGAIRSLKFEAFNQQWLKLAGPEAHQLMAAAAAWQQAQLQAYIQQLHTQQQQDATATPFSTMLPQQEYDKGSASMRQQQQRRDAMSGYHCGQQQQLEGQYAGGYQGGGGAQGYSPYAFDDALNGYFAQQQQHQQQQEREEEEQGGRQLQWVGSTAGGVGAEVEGSAAVARSSSMGRTSIVTAGGQCMVLDFDAFVSEAGTAGQ